MIKLIVSDIDGTLVKDGTLDINPEYMDVIKTLTEKGIHRCSDGSGIPMGMTSEKYRIWQKTLRANRL